MNPRDTTHRFSLATRLLLLSVGLIVLVATAASGCAMEDAMEVHAPSERQVASCAARYNEDERNAKTTREWVDLKPRAAVRIGIESGGSCVVLLDSSEQQLEVVERDEAFETRRVFGDAGAYPEAVDVEVEPDGSLGTRSKDDVRIGAAVQRAFGPDATKDRDAGVVIGARSGACDVRSPQVVLGEVVRLIGREDPEGQDVRLGNDHVVSVVCNRTWYVLATWRSNDRDVLGVFAGRPGRLRALDDAPPPCVVPGDVAALWGIPRAQCPKSRVEATAPETQSAGQTARPREES